MAKSKWLDVGTVLRKKDGGGSYIRIKENVSLKKDTILQVQDPREKLDRLAEAGHMSPDEAEERKARIPDFVLFDIVLPPAKD